MSKREAAGYLVQLKDLLMHRLTGPSRPRREYQQMTLDDVAKVSLRPSADRVPKQ